VRPFQVIVPSDGLPIVLLFPQQHLLLCPRFPAFFILILTPAIDAKCSGRSSLSVLPFIATTLESRMPFDPYPSKIFLVISKPRIATATSIGLSVALFPFFARFLSFRFLSMSQNPP